MKNILIFGAGSAIARETAINFAREGAQFYLVDLTEERAETVGKHINAHWQVKYYAAQADAVDFDSHKQIFADADKAMGSIDAVLIAHGTLPDNDKAAEDVEYALNHFAINGTSVISLCTHAANYFQKKKKGTLAVISSVAGDRGRASNYLYGSAKSAVSEFLSGLRGRMSEFGVNVITIKPGMVDTPMTADMPKGPLFSKPEVIAKGIYNAMKSGKDIVYLPSWWKLIMLIIKLIPESIFKKLKF